MTTALHAPTSALVAAAWIKLVLPDVSGVGRRLPAVSDAMRAGGFVRVQVLGGRTAVDYALREPVVVAECWWPPATDSQTPPWNKAGGLANRLLLATYEPSYMHRDVDLSSVGSYGAANVRTVVALDEPQEVLDDPSNFARNDIRLAFSWTPA